MQRAAKQPPTTIAEISIERKSSSSASRSAPAQTEAAAAESSEAATPVDWPPVGAKVVFSAASGKHRFCSWEARVVGYGKFPKSEWPNITLAFECRCCSALEKTYCLKSVSSITGA